MADAERQGPSGPLSGDQGPSGPLSGDQGPSGPRSGEQGPRPNPRKVREGVVVSAAMDKTAVVAVVERVRHGRYTKTVQRTKRIHAHDENNELRVGDRVRIGETRPLSKLKHWRVVEVLERAK
jgi:small subunit ribosomal protein S17